MFLQNFRMSSTDTTWYHGSDSIVPYARILEATVLSLQDHRAWHLVKFSNERDSSDARDV